MAKKTGKEKAGSSLGISIFVIIALLVLVTAGCGVVSTLLFGDTAVRQAIKEELQRSHSTQAILQPQRYRQLKLISEVIQSEGDLTALLAEAAEAPAEEWDPEPLRLRLEEYQNKLSFNLAIVLDDEAWVVPRSGDPDEDDLSANPLVAKALADDEAFGVWPMGEGLYHAAVVQLVQDYERVGYLVLASTIDSPLALQVKRACGAEIVFLTQSPTGWAATASTLDAQKDTELIAELRVKGYGSDRIRTIDDAELRFAGGTWLAFLTPLRDASDQTVGAMVALTLLDDQLAGLQQIRLVLYGSAAAALIVGLILSLLLARGTGKPVSLLAAAAAEASRGNYDVAVPSVGGQFAPLAGSLAKMASQMRQKRILESFAGQVARYLPEPAKAEAVGPPRAAEAALVVVEMRRFANPKISYDPEENLGRYARDLQRISGVVKARKGTIEAVFGHRLMAAFEGEGNALRALSAATEILLMLTQREDAFDEPVPPVVALGMGSVVTGSVLWDGRSGTAVAGLPVQQLESLLREAAPGEIYFSKSIHAALAEQFQGAGIEVRSQRGLLSPQPLYLLSAEVAAGLTGVKPQPEKPAGLAAEKRTLADVSPGAVLANRFAIQAEIGTGSMGAVFKAEDRDRAELVTLKILYPEVMADANRFERLKQVIRVARTINHPHIINVLDFGEAEGLPYISSHFERGMNLRFVLERRKQVPMMTGFLLVRQICDALAAAHHEKLVHGGLKPENILVDATGHLRLMDFGLTSPIGGGGRAAAVTGAPYLAPEQLEGREAAPPSDVYACGVLFYEMLTGQLPVAGRTPAEIRQRLMEHDPAVPSSLNPEIPPQLEQVIMQCLAQGAGQRFASVQELIKALEALRE
ncbi:MAG: protein kinase [bacterium]|nr:protein kinase [bacterium]